MAQRQNSFEVSVKRLLLIRFICSATSEPFVHAELPKPSTPPSHLRDLVWWSRGARAHRQLKKSHLASVEGGGGGGCSEVGVLGGLGRRSRAGQSK